MKEQNVVMHSFILPFCWGVISEDKEDDKNPGESFTWGRTPIKMTSDLRALGIVGNYVLVQKYLPLRATTKHALVLFCRFKLFVK